MTHIVATLLVIFISGVGFGLLSGPMVVGYMKMIKIEDEGGKSEIADVFKGFDNFVPALLAVLVGSIIVSIGYMLCVLPGMLLMAIIPTAAYLGRVVRMTASTPSNALGRRSKKICSAHFLHAHTGHHR